MSSKPYLAVLAAIAALGLAACGGDDDDGGGALTKADIVKKANEICTKYDKDLSAVKRPGDINDPTQAAPYFRSISDISQKRQGELEDLEPAGDVKADYEAFTGGQKKVADLIGQIAGAAEAKDATKGAALLQQATTAGTPADAAARKVGATACA